MQPAKTLLLQCGPLASSSRKFYSFERLLNPTYKIKNLDFISLPVSIRTLFRNISTINF